MAGRRGKWLVLAVWIVLAVVFASLGSKLADKTQNDNESFLPESAESTRSSRALNKEFTAGETSNGLIVYQREGASPRRTRRRSAGTVQVPPRTTSHATTVVPFRPAAARRRLPRRGGRLHARSPSPTDFDKLGDWGKEVKNATGEGSGGLKIYLTGDLRLQHRRRRGLQLDRHQVLLATVLLVLILLGAIYRSPIVALIPIVVVGVAYTVAHGLIYLYADTGATVTSKRDQIIVVLMFGVGTDYCLLLVSRYREELRTHEDKHEAMQRTVRRVGPAILASGLTVTLAMLVLLVAEVGSVHTLGPVAAIGVFCVLAAGLTILPALLTIAGRRGFWPRQRSSPSTRSRRRAARRGVWRESATASCTGPCRALVATVTLFGAGTLGLLAYKVD